MSERERQEEAAEAQEKKTPATRSGQRDPQEPAAPADASLLPTGTAAADPEHPPERPSRTSAA